MEKIRGFEEVRIAKSQKDDPLKTSTVTGPSMGGKLAMAANKLGLEGKKVTKIETVDEEMDIKVLLHWEEVPEASMRWI